MYSQSVINKEIIPLHPINLNNKSKMKTNYFMKGITMLFLIFCANISAQQVIADFENGTFNGKNMTVINNGTNQSNNDVSVIDNPTTNGINQSKKVGKFIKKVSTGAEISAGLYITGFNLDFSTDKYIHIKILKNRASSVKLQIFDSSDGEQYTLYSSTKNYNTAGEWQDLVFDFPQVSGNFPEINLFPDYDENSPNDNNDITIYFDDIKLNNNPSSETLSATEFSKLNDDIKLHAAPSKLFFTVNEKAKQLNVYNIEGKNIYTTQKINIGNNEINIPNLKTGIFIVEIITEKRITRKKIIIK